jgi:hypothetical protein
LVKVCELIEKQSSSAPIKVAGRSRYTEPIRTPSNGGVVFKVSESDQLIGGKHTQFEYAIANNQIYYDISFVDCAKGESAANCPGHAKGLKMYSTNVSSLLKPFATVNVHVHVGLQKRDAD